MFVVFLCKVKKFKSLIKENNCLNIFINSSQDIYYASAVIFLYLRVVPRILHPKGLP